MPRMKIMIPAILLTIQRLRRRNFFLNLFTMEINSAHHEHAPKNTPQSTAAMLDVLALALIKSSFTKANKPIRKKIVIGFVSVNKNVEAKSSISLNLPTFGFFNCFMGFEK